MTIRAGRRSLAPVALIFLLFLPCRGDEPSQRASLSASPDPGRDASVAPASRRLLPYRIEHGPRKYLEWLYKDPVNLFLGPFRWSSREWERFGLSTLAVAGTLPLDARVRDFVQDRHSSRLESTLRPIRDHFIEGPLEIYGAGLFVAGLASRDERIADSGFIAMEAVFYAARVSALIKGLSKRERPVFANGPYEFHGPFGSPRGRSTSFVSGDAITAFAFAASVGEVYRDPRIRWPLYGVAMAVGAQRLERDAHWLSDVVGAALLGHAIGWTLARFHYGNRSGRAAVRPFLSGGFVGAAVAFP